MAPLVSNRQHEHPKALKSPYATAPLRPAPTALHAPPRLHDIRKSRFGHRLRRTQHTSYHYWQRHLDNGDPSDPLKDSLAATATSALEPTAIASPTISPSRSLRTPHGSTDVVFIAVGSAIAMVLIFISIFLFVRAHWFSLSSAFKCCYRRPPRPRGIGFSPRKIGRPRPINDDDDDDDPYITTPTTFVYVERFDGPPQLQLEKTQSHDLFTSTQTALNRIIPPSRSLPDHGAKDVNEDIMKITRTRTCPLNSGTCTDKGLGSPTQCSASSSGVAGRPRGASDASQSSGSSETHETDLTDLFSPALMASCQSSMTSMASSTSVSVAESSEDESEPEVFEVKRAHSQSIEYKKGVLMAFASQASVSGVSESSSAPATSPSIVISEPSLAAKASSCSTIYSLSGSCSGRLGAGGVKSGLSMSSLARENSLGTVSSISSNFSLTTRTETSCLADEDHLQLQPRIPFLMVTEPSSSSIYTLSTQTSSASVDLGDFPIPPAVAKPVKPLYLKLMEQAKTHALEAQRRAWRNHPENSSLKQRRSTVEQFIMMYASA